MRLPQKYRIKTPTTSPPPNKPQYHNYYTLDHKILSKPQRYLSSSMPLLTSTTKQHSKLQLTLLGSCALKRAHAGGKEGCSITVLSSFFTTERLVHLLRNQPLTNFKLIQWVSKKTVQT